MGWAEDLRTALEASRIEARKRAHIEVREEHLLLSLLGVSGDLLAELSRENISAALLRDQLEAALDKLPAANGYRDAVPPTLSTTVKEVFATATPRLLDRVFKQNRVRLFYQLYQSSLKGRPLFEAAKWDVAPIRSLRRAAARQAKRRAHGNVLLAHLFIQLTENDERFMTALRCAGHDPKETALLMNRVVTETFFGTKLPTTESLVQYASLTANVARRRELDSRSIVVLALRDARSVSFFDALGLSRTNLLYAFVHGSADEATIVVPPSERVEVLFIDDDFTTFEVVRGLLVSIFDRSESDAIELTRAVSREGKAVVAVLDRAEAVVKVERARAAARAQLMPLKIETREVS